MAEALDCVEGVPSIGATATQREKTMLGPRPIYNINLCYEAYFCKVMEVSAESLSAACECAMAQADDGCAWKDTLASSNCWIESVDDAMDLVPEEYSEEAIRCGGAEVVARRLHAALRSLVRACERNPKALSAIGSDVERAKAVLSEVNYD
jgi:hypothetical protein